MRLSQVFRSSCRGDLGFVDVLVHAQIEFLERFGAMGPRE